MDNNNQKKVDVESIEELKKLKDISDLNSGLFNVLKTPTGNVLGNPVDKPTGNISDYIIKMMHK